MSSTRCVAISWVAHAPRHQTWRPAHGAGRQSGSLQKTGRFLSRRRGTQTCRRSSTNFTDRLRHVRNQNVRLSNVQSAPQPQNKQSSFKKPGKPHWKDAKRPDNRPGQSRIREDSAFAGIFQAHVPHFRRSHRLPIVAATAALRRPAAAAVLPSADAEGSLRGRPAGLPRVAR